MTISLAPIFSSLRFTLLNPWFWLVVLAGAAISIAQNFVWLDWWSLVPAAIFTGGAFLGFWIIMAHETWIPAIIKNLPTLDETDAGAVAVLRSPLMLLLLPILGTFLLFLPTSPLGQGVFWGVLGWYALEAWNILRGRPEWIARYFPGNSTLQNEPLYQGVTWMFLGFCFIYALVLVLF